MCDDELAGLRENPVKEALETLLGTLIQSIGRLVCNYELGIGTGGYCYGHTLRHAPRKLKRVFLHDTFRMFKS